MNKKRPGNGIWQRGDSWYVEWTIQSQRYREHLGPVSKKLAREIAVRRKAELFERRLKPTAQDPLFEKFSQEYIENISINKRPITGTRFPLGISYRFSRKRDYLR